MAVTVALVVKTAPELSSEQSDRVQLFIDIAKTMIAESVWGTKYDYAVALMTAHLITMANQGGAGAAGPVTSERVGQIQVSYAQMTTKEVDDELASTRYGQAYLMLRRTIPVTPILV